MADMTIELAMNAATKAMTSLTLVCETAEDRQESMLCCVMALLLVESRAKAAVEALVNRGYFSKETIAHVREGCFAFETKAATTIFSGGI